MSEGEVDQLREHFCRWQDGKYAVFAERSDAELQQRIDAAKAWIAGDRLSWKVVVLDELISLSHPEEDE